MQEATLTMHAYCGMSIPLIERQDRMPVENARDRAARILRVRRNSGHYVSVLRKGESWEIAEPEDCALIPDTAGTLSLDLVWRCDYCGRECVPGATACESCDETYRDWEALQNNLRRVRED